MTSKRSQQHKDLRQNPLWRKRVVKDKRRKVRAKEVEKQIRSDAGREG